LHRSPERARDWRVRHAIVLVLLLVGCRNDHASVRVIACLGDSITEGIVTPFVRDRGGGFPGRLQRRLGDGVRVLNHGVGGSTAALWLLDPATPEGTRALQTFSAAMPDRPAADAGSQRGSIAATVLAGDRPDLVILLIGVNDVLAHRADGTAAVDTVVGSVEAVRREASSVARRVLVATLLPNSRDPPALVTAVSARLRAAHPDALLLGERFEAAGGRRLLADGIHPSEEGHEVLAGIVADELVRRGLVAPPAQPPG
jgi:lysophospholipase L1-like esterase